MNVVLTKVFWGEPLMKDTPSRIHATAKTVDGEISVSLRPIAASRLADVSFTPVWIWYVQGGLGCFNSQPITFVLYELLPSCGWRKLKKFAVFFSELRQPQSEQNENGDGSVATVANRDLGRLAAASKKKQQIVLLPEFGHDHVARGSSGLKPLRRRAPSMGHFIHTSRRVGGCIIGETGECAGWRR